MISSILQRELIEINSVLNIVWTPCEYAQFHDFITSACSPCNIINLDDTYHGMNDVSIIICNNRLTHLDKAVELSKFFLSPLLIIDHDTKPSIVNNELGLDIPISPAYHIATSKNIYSSWNNIQNTVLEYNTNNDQSKNIWKNLIFQLCKSLVVIKDDQNIKQEK